MKRLNFLSKEQLRFIKFAHDHKIRINAGLRYVGIIFICFAYFLLALSTIFFEPVSGKYPIFEIFFLQFLTVLIIFFCLLWSTKNRDFSNFIPKEKSLVLSRGIVAVLTYFAYFSSKIWVNIIDNSTLFSIDALVIPVVMRLLFKIFIPKLAWIGLWVGFLGVFFINAFDIRIFSLGGLIGIASGLGLAYIVLITSYMVKNDSPLVIGFYEALIGSIFSGIIVLLTGWETPDIASLISIVSQGALFAIALFLFLDAFYYTEAYIIGALGYALTVFIIFLEALILGKLIDSNSLIGTLLVCSGGLMVIVSTYNHEKKNKIHHKNEN